MRHENQRSGESVVANCGRSTPAALDAALANPDRGIFHIQNANYWRFIAIEYGYTFLL